MNHGPDEPKRQRIEAMYQKGRKSFPEVSEIAADELQRRRCEENLVLVDVRTPQEQAVSMIPGAVTAQAFEANRKDYEGSTVVCYCTVGIRSGKYAKDLQAQGWKVLNLKGSLLAWTHTGGPLMNAHGPTRKLHVHSKRWDLVADGYEAVW
jgi:rhodanese-related sulfurtransferase